MNKETVFKVLEWLGNGRMRDQSWHDAEVLFRLAWHYAGSPEDKERVNTARQSADEKDTVRVRRVEEAKERGHYEFFKEEMQKKDAYYRGQIDMLKEGLGR